MENKRMMAIGKRVRSQQAWLLYAGALALQAFRARPPVRKVVKLRLKDLTREQMQAILTEYFIRGED